MEEPRQNAEHGDRAMMDHVILKTVVGSGAHGLAIEGTDDHDEMAVYIEPPENVMGAAPSADSYVWRTQPEGQRSGPGDTDLMGYSLRKYSALAIKGNPTVMVPLWVPESSVLTTTWQGATLREHRDLFMSQHAIHRFLGYMEAQHERMMGRGRQSRVPNRPELIEKYGWDVKYGSHALRLALQGLEIAKTGHLTLPMPDADRQLVLAVKTGQYPRDTVSSWIRTTSAFIQEMLDKDTIAVPEEPDYERISAMLIYLHLETWERENRG